jgi:hypothetical protein
MVSALAAIWRLLPTRIPSAQTRGIGEVDVRTKMKAAWYEKQRAPRDVLVVGFERITMTPGTAFLVSFGTRNGLLGRCTIHRDSMSFRTRQACTSTGEKQTAPERTSSYQLRRSGLNGEVLSDLRETFMPDL